MRDNVSKSNKNHLSIRICHCRKIILSKQNLLKTQITKLCARQQKNHLAIQQHLPKSYTTVTALQHWSASCQPTPHTNARTAKRIDITAVGDTAPLH